jgi:hypothetical protein
MNAPPVTPRVVAAVAPDLEPRIRAIVPPCELRFVSSKTQLLAELRDARCSLLLVGTHFDESTALAAIEYALARDETFPVVCVRGQPFTGAPDGSTVDAFRLASRALGAHNFIDLLQYSDDEAGNGRVRRMLERLLTPCESH